jgi:hypothetical protein
VKKLVMDVLTKFRNGDYFFSYKDYVLRIVERDVNTVDDEEAFDAALAALRQIQETCELLELKLNKAQREGTDVSIS